MKRDQDKTQTGVERHSEEAVRKYPLNPKRLALLARKAGFPCDVEEDGVTLETDAGTVHLEYSDLFQTLSFRTWIGTERITHPEDLLLIVGRMNRRTIGTRFHLLEDDPETIECQLFHLCEGSGMNAITMARLLHRLVCDVNEAVTIMAAFESEEKSVIQKLRIDWR